VYGTEADFPNSIVFNALFTIRFTD